MWQPSPQWVNLSQHKLNFLTFCTLSRLGLMCVTRLEAYQFGCNSSRLQHIGQKSPAVLQCQRQLIKVHLKIGQFVGLGEDLRNRVERVKFLALKLALAPFPNVTIVTELNASHEGWNT